MRQIETIRAALDAAGRLASYSYHHAQRPTSENRRKLTTAENDYRATEAPARAALAEIETALKAGDELAIAANCNHSSDPDDPDGRYCYVCGKIAAYRAARKTD